MITRHELRDLFLTRSFTEERGDDNVDLISLSDVFDLLEENFTIYSKIAGHEYGYAKAGPLNPQVILIGDDADYENYLKDLDANPTTQLRRYYRRPKEVRRWEEISGPDAAFLD